MASEKVYFYCFDGDKIGERVQRHLMNEDIGGAVSFSSEVNSIMDEITSIMEIRSTQCLFRGGDSLIFRGYNDIPDELIPYRFDEISFSVGIGCSMQCAALALFKAKSFGRCRVERLLT